MITIRTDTLDKKKLINNLENVNGVKITDYCQYCQYHTTKPRNMRMHLTSSKHHKNIHYTVIRLINNDVIIENGLRVNSLFFNFYLNQLYK